MRGLLKERLCSDLGRLTHSASFTQSGVGQRQGLREEGHMHLYIQRRTSMLHQTHHYTLRAEPASTPAANIQVNTGFRGPSDSLGPGLGTPAGPVALWEWVGDSCTKFRFSRSSSPLDHSFPPSLSYPLSLLSSRSRQSLLPLFALKYRR